MTTALALADALEELADERALADAGIADDHDLALALRDEDIAPRVAQRLELEVAAVQATAVAALAHPLRALLGAAQAIHARALHARIGLFVDVARLRCARAAGLVGRQIDRGQRFEVPLVARAAEHASADEDLRAARLPRELVRERGGGVLDVEHMFAPLRRLGLLVRALHERGAALDGEREPQLRLDVTADAIERVDEREGQADRATGVVLARHGQADHHADRRLAGVTSRRGRERGDLGDRDVLAVGREPRRVEDRLVLERDIARHFVEVVDEARRAARTEPALERRHAAQDALQHVDVLALAIARRCTRVEGHRPGDLLHRDLDRG